MNLASNKSLIVSLLLIFKKEKKKKEQKFNLYIVLANSVLKEHNILIV